MAGWETQAYTEGRGKGPEEPDTHVVDTVVKRPPPGSTRSGTSTGGKAVAKKQYLVW